MRFDQPIPRTRDLSISNRCTMDCQSMSRYPTNWQQRTPYCHMTGSPYLTNQASRCLRKPRRCDFVNASSNFPMQIPHQFHIREQQHRSHDAPCYDFTSSQYWYSRGDIHRERHVGKQGLVSERQVDRSFVCTSPSHSCRKIRIAPYRIFESCDETPCCRLSETGRSERHNRIDVISS